ncbi:hypothetical protein F0U60_47170 [Archangium minus]|uniref:Lipoprotein n=1 Tax=Archangium minus TaxID=83450 RepID=A0ABY9X639_9BACT|nr:hypothetical protein F0U60_47170 [Archangium minus]
MENGSVKVFLPPRPVPPSLGTLSVTEARILLETLTAVQPSPEPRLRLLEVAGPRHPPQYATQQFQLQVRKEFLAGFGSGVLPLPDSAEGSPLWAALKMSPRFMGEGVREAAEELFNSPLFIHGVYLSVMLYFSAWLMPEPLFSKAFAATLTVRLAMVVGLVELARVAQACLRLHQEAQAARSPAQLEAASEHFGAAIGGVGFRVVVLVATMGMGRLLPDVPAGGIAGEVRSWSAALARGASVGTVSTAQVVADGTIVVTGVSADLAISSTCVNMGVCSMASSSSGRSPALSTRYGPPHTRSNPPHNEAIEDELASRESAGHTRLDKNKVQRDSAGDRVFDTRPVKGTRFRKPDASSLRPDGVRHNTNYVSSAKDLRRELDAFEAMCRADPDAIHELYLLNGTLVRRYVPPGVQYP